MRIQACDSRKKVKKCVQVEILNAVRSINKLITTQNYANRLNRCRSWDSGATSSINQCLRATSRTCIHVSLRYFCAMLGRATIAGLIRLSALISAVPTVLIWLHFWRSCCRLFSHLKLDRNNLYK